MVKCESLRINMFRITHTGKSVNFPVTSCLQLSFHLTFKFLVLRTNRQFFLFFFSLLYVKCKTTNQSGRSHADISILKSANLNTKS